MTSMLLFVPLLIQFTYEMRHAEMNGLLTSSSDEYRGLGYNPTGGGGGGGAEILLGAV